jgi:hypothetical protein
MIQRDPDERILDDRPVPDDIPPIPLLYPAFGHFLDIMDGSDDVPGLADVKVPELRTAVDGLATEMSKYFEKEHQHRDNGLHQLNLIFHAREGTSIPPISASAISPVISDGHNITGEVDGGTTSIVVEFKNSQAQISAVPQAEAVGYVGHLHKRLAKEAFLQWRVPCLGLTIVGKLDTFVFQGYLMIGCLGCDITFYAILAVDRQIRLVSLTPSYSCIGSASDGCDCKYLYRAFTAASVLQAHILEDALKLRDARTSGTAKSLGVPRRCPAISKLLVSPGTQTYLSFKNLAPFDDRANRLLYMAERWDGTGNILIKFARQYSIELHSYCANKGHAPLMLGYERLPGGWYGVAMEFVDPSTSITKSDVLVDHLDRWKTELGHLLNGFHAKDLVHGDLRDANIICKGESVMLVDFDWGGRVGEALYPTLELNPELLDGRTSDGFDITKDDDVWVLKKTMVKLRDLVQSRVTTRV